MLPVPTSRVGTGSDNCAINIKAAASATIAVKSYKNNVICAT